MTTDYMVMPSRALYELSLPLNLNTADYWFLVRLPGISPAKAREIEQERQYAPFASLSDFKMRMQLTHHVMYSIKNLAFVR